MKKFSLSFTFFLVYLIGWSQTLDTLDFDSFQTWVRSYHPIAAQAEINLRMGDMEVRQARGGFDPLLYGTMDKKEFKENTYYDKQEAGISIPTWAGIELNGTFERNTGQFLNPEGSVPIDGLFAAGASVNLGQGLILDERRAALRQAQIYQESTVSQREQLLNELYFNASESYWKWAVAHENVKVLNEGVELAKIRFDAIKIAYQQGDLPAIDTVEAFAILLNRQYSLQSAENAFFGASQLLNTFLWDEDGNPMLLESGVIPQGLYDEFAPILEKEDLRVAVSSHPLLEIADFELASLGVERKLKGQQILPVVKLKYNFLTENLGDFNSPFFENNYKWGVSVYTPLLWRKSRGALGLANAKIDFKQNSRDLKEVELRTKLEAEINSFEVINTQIVTFSQNVTSLESLLQGEIRRFEIGESSLFLINAREVSLFSSKLTLNDLVSKRRINFAKSRFAAGLGFDE
ncbi:TolC family protein [Algoriphagus marinus]|uniref:TolC family protein n=1 Tax=Algoriphagus marinus TaxID=1925762 RepID=UPI00094B95CD|nr:TolC family protein [Algoriphagus marinus]